MKPVLPKREVSNEFHRKNHTVDKLDHNKIRHNQTQGGALINNRSFD